MASVFVHWAPLLKMRVFTVHFQKTTHLLITLDSKFYDVVPSIEKTIQGVSLIVEIVALIKLKQTIVLRTVGYRIVLYEKTLGGPFAIGLYRENAIAIESEATYSLNI